MSKAKTAALSSSENNSQRQPLYIWPSLLGKRLRFGSTVWTMALGLASFTMVSKTSAFDKISNATASVTHSLGKMFEDGPENQKLASALPTITSAYYTDTLRYGDNEKLDEVADTAKTAEGFKHGMTAVLGTPLTAEQVFEKRKANEADYQQFVTNAYQARMGKAIPDTILKVEAEVSPIRGVEFDQLSVNSLQGPRNGRIHEGVDLRASAGTVLQSPVNGTIKELDFSKKSGGKVVIQGDDGSEHTYWHVKHMLMEVSKGKGKGKGKNKSKWVRVLQEGQRIEAGEQFGNVGQGRDAGIDHYSFSFKTGKLVPVYIPPHCHWEVRKDGKLLNAEEAIYTNGVITSLKQPKNKKDQLSAHTLRLMQMDEAGLWVSQLPETVKELNLPSHYNFKKHKKIAAKAQNEAITDAKKVVKEVFKNADGELKTQIANDRKYAMISAFGKDAASDIAVNEAPKKEEKVDNSAALAASKAKGDVNKKVSDEEGIEIDGQIIGEYEGRETYGKGNDIAELPLDSLQKWMKQDPEWNKLAKEVNRPIADVVFSFGKVTGVESQRDPTIVAKDKYYTDANGKRKKETRTAGGLFQMVKDSRNGAISDLNEDMPEGYEIQWPSKKEMGTVKGVKTQIRVAGRLARNKLHDILVQDKILQSLSGESALNRVYRDSATGELKYESKFSAVVNAWGPGTGDLKYEDELFPSLPKPKKDRKLDGYINLRARAIVAAQKTGSLPVHHTDVKNYKTGEVQPFSDRNGFVKSTKAEKKIEQKVAEEMKQLKAVSYRYSENKNSLDIQEHGSMSVDAAGKLNFYLKNTDMSKIAFADERRKTAPALALT